MKRLIAVLLALVLIVMPVSAETGSFFDYTDDILESGDLIYYFQELSLTLPASWRGKVMAEQDESGVSFYQISSHENYLKEGIKNGGFLFELGASVNHDFSKLPSFRYIGFCEESAMNYYLRLPTDYPAYNEEAIRAEYDEMLGQIDYVVENAKFYADQNKKDDSEDTPAPAGAYEENASEGITSGLAGSDAVSEDKEAAEEDDSQNPSWTPQQVRYSFEHSMMPRYFYDRPDSVLGAIYHNGFYPLWKVVCEENNVNPTYPEKDYIVHWYTVDQKAELVTGIPLTRRLSWFRSSFPIPIPLHSATGFTSSTAPTMTTLSTTPSRVMTLLRTPLSSAHGTKTGITKSSIRWITWTKKTAATRTLSKKKPR